jgi:hypothetical protein
VNWNSTNVKFFYTHADGAIRSQDYDGTSWSKSSGAIITPKSDSPFAAIGWVGGVNERQVRVYTLDEENYIHESAWSTLNPSWVTTYLPGDRRQTAQDSKLAARCWFSDGLLSVRLYYQGDDGYIHEAAYSNRSWTGGLSTKPSDFPLARQGSALSVVTFPQENDLDAKLFYQDRDGHLRSYDYTPAATFSTSWRNGSDVIGGGGPSFLATAATSDLTLRLFFFDEAAARLELSSYNTAAAAPFSTPENITAAAAPGVAAVALGQDVRVLYQRTNDSFAQLAYVKRENKWSMSFLS